MSNPVAFTGVPPDEEPQGAYLIGHLATRHDVRHVLELNRAEVAALLSQAGRRVPADCYLVTNGSKLVIEWTERRDD